jgi:NADH dehydrogenase FAD-containing subunit
VARVVVVGGGYGGITASLGLDAVADVVLVEPKDAFQHNVAALRAVVDPDWLPRIFLPYDRLLSRGTVVRDRAVSVGDDGVLLASGRWLDASFVVVATGSTYPFPAKSTLDSAASIERYRALHTELARASRVTLVGAGPVGVEFAGEIASAWPAKLVTLVDVAPDIMAGPYDQRLRDELHRQLEELSVKLMLGTTTVPAADITFECHGLSPVNPVSDGHLQVEDDLRVAGYACVYAVGDIAAGDANRVAVARAQAECVAANIKARLIGGPPVSYQRQPVSIVVPLGPSGGAGQRADTGEIIPAETVSRLKGADMFVGRYRQLFNLD